MAGDKPRLGEKTVYPEHYDPELLVAIPRQEGRAHLNLPDTMQGEDIWTAYELSWLTAGGKPCVAIGEFRVSCHSPNIIESKSLKLYLNSLNQKRFSSALEVRELVARDLSAGFGAPVTLVIHSPEEFGQRGVARLPGQCIDGLEVACEEFERNPHLLARHSDDIVEEALYSNLLKTNCPVTGQPDWASVGIRYRGAKLDREGLLKYLVSFRQHQDFHENCVETIFCDILTRCGPGELTVYARYTRRGGLDINPLRTTAGAVAGHSRLARQ